MTLCNYLSQFKRKEGEAFGVEKYREIVLLFLKSTPYACAEN
jgi:hypothetical protein